MENITGLMDRMTDPQHAGLLNAFISSELVSKADPDRKENLLRDLASSVARNQQLTDIYTSTAITGLVNRFEENFKSKRKIFVSARLSASDQVRLTETFCDFVLDFSRASDSGAHAFARAHRKLSFEYFLKKTGITKLSQPGPGYDVLFKDVGANPVSHLLNDRFHSHCCTPVLDVNDASRTARYHQHLRSVDTSQMSPERARHYNQHIIQDGRVVCKTVAEKCFVKAPVVFFLHSVYDISVPDIAQIMFNADAHVAYGCFIFDVSVLYLHQGELPAIGCCFKRIRRNNRVFIRFWFPNDSQLGYEHDFYNYVALIKTFTIEHEHQGSKYYYLNNIFMIRDNVAYFEILRNNVPVIPRSTAFRVLTDTSLEGMTVVNYWNYDTISDSLSIGNYRDRMSPVRLIVPTGLFENLVTYTFNLPESKFTVRNILCAATSLNNRFVTNGAAVKSGPKIPPFELQKLAHAVFLLVYVASYECTKATAVLIAEETRIRHLSESNVVRRMYENIRSKIVRSLTFSVEADASNAVIAESVDEQITASECITTSRLKAFVDWCMRATSVKRILDVSFQQGFVKYFTVEEEIDNILQQVHEFDRAIINDSNIDIDPFLAMLMTLPAEDVKPQVDVRMCEKHQCSADVRVVPNSSEGDCVLQTVIDSEHTEFTDIAKLKLRLLGSAYLPLFVLRDELTEYLECKRKLPPSMELLMLCCMEFRFSICIHVDETHYRFFRGPQIHVTISEGHCQFLAADKRIPETFDVDLQSVNVPDDDQDYDLIDRDQLAPIMNMLKVLPGKNFEKIDSLLSLYRTVDPSLNCSSLGYRSIHGLLTAESIHRCFEHRSNEPLLFVGGNVAQLEAVMSNVDSIVHFVSGRDTNDIRETSAQSRLVQYTSSISSCDLKNDSVKIEIYKMLLTNATAGFRRVYCGNAYFTDGYLVPDNDRYFTSVPNNLHFCLSVLTIGGQLVFEITDLTSESSHRLLQLISTMFSTVRIVMHTLAQQALWCFSVVCVGYLGRRCVRDQLLGDWGEISLDTDFRNKMVGIYSMCNDSIRILSESVIKESRNRRPERFFESSNYENTDLYQLMGNKYSGNRSLCSVTSRPRMATRGKNLSVMSRLLSSGRSYLFSKSFVSVADVLCFDENSSIDTENMISYKFRDLHPLFKESKNPVVVTHNTTGPIDEKRLAEDGVVDTVDSSTVRTAGLVARLPSHDVLRNGMRVCSMIQPTGRVNVERLPVYSVNDSTQTSVTAVSEKSEEQAFPTPSTETRAIVNRFSSIANEVNDAESDSGRPQPADLFKFIGVNAADYDGDIIRYFDEAVTEKDHLPNIIQEISPQRQKAIDYLSEVHDRTHGYESEVQSVTHLSISDPDDFPVDAVVNTPADKRPVVAAVNEFRTMLRLTHQAHVENCSRVFKIYVGFFKKYGSTIHDDVFPANFGTHVIPHARDFGILNPQGEWAIPPRNGSRNIKDYGWFFDGKHFVRFKGESRLIGSQYNHCVVINDYCLKALDGLTYESVKDIDVSDVDLSSVDFVQAVAGAGKTTYIINNHGDVSRPKNERSNVVLCTTDGRDDFCERVKRSIPYGTHGFYEPLMKTHYRTLASFLINWRNVQKQDTLFIDEAFMHHPGALFLAIKISGASKVEILGDKMQIPYVNRLETFDMQHGDLNQFIKPTRMMSHSYRCPADVARMISCYYEDQGLVEKQGARGMTSSRAVKTRSMHVEKFMAYSTVTDLGPDTQYLTFTQSCKKALNRVNCATVHEFEGKQAENVVLVRDTEFLEDRLPNELCYLIVAVTRHTKSFVYCTKRPDDRLSKMIYRLYNSTSDFSSHLLLNSGSVNFSSRYLGCLQKYDDPRSYKTFKNRDPRGKSSYHLLQFAPDAGKLCVTHSRKKHGLEITVHFPSRAVAQLLRRVTSEIAEIVTREKVTELDLHNSCFSSIEPIAVNSILYQFVGKQIRYFRGITARDEEVPFEVFSLLNRNAIYGMGPKVDLPLETITAFQPKTKNDEIETIDVHDLQEFIDDCFGKASLADQKLDSWMVHHYDLSLSLGDVRIIPHKGLYAPEYYDKMSPVLHTPIPYTRNEFTSELLVALQKRNCNVPECVGIVNVRDVASNMIENFVERCLDRRMTVDIVSEPIEINQVDVCDWLKNQPLQVLEQLESQFALHDTPLNEYLMSIKKVAKPVLKRDADESYAPLQTILYHEKFINAIFCPIFRQIKERLHACLNVNLKVFSDVSIADFERILNRDVLDQPFALFSGDDSLIYNGKTFLEIDISKYDKSQGDLALEYELRYMRFFGVPEYYVELWRNAHSNTVATSRNTGTKINIPYQRKSGDASTFLGNTLFLMGVLSYLIPFNDLSQLDYTSCVRPHTFNYVFNLEVKFFRYQYPYFCSKFYLRDSNNRWRVVADPVKLVCKLGRHDLVNPMHVECYRISLDDHLSSFEDVSVSYELSEALVERYGLVRDHSRLFRQFPALSNKSIFQKLYYIAPGANIDFMRYGFTFND